MIFVVVANLKMQALLYTRQNTDGLLWRLFVTNVLKCLVNTVDFRFERPNTEPS